MRKKQKTKTFNPFLKIPECSKHPLCKHGQYPNLLLPLSLASAGGEEHSGHLVHLLINMQKHSPALGLQKLTVCPQPSGLHYEPGNSSGCTIGYPSCSIQAIYRHCQMFLAGKTASCYENSTLCHSLQGANSEYLFVVLENSFKDDLK